MRRELAALLLLVLSPLMMRGQSTTASLTGRISDSHRAVISAASVQVINTSTGIHYHGLTNQAGIYYVSDLPPGGYRIEVEKLGFIAVIESGIILHVQDALEVNFEMELGSASESVTVAGGAVVKFGPESDWIRIAHLTLAPLLGTTLASTLFAVALLASGQSSTITGTLAGQVVMEGFVNIRLRPWLRRLLTRLIAIIPAIVVLGYYGENKTTQLLVASQVVLSMQLGFAVWPLMRFTGEKAKMGEFVNAPWLQAVAWVVAVVIAGLNSWLLVLTFTGA